MFGVCANKWSPDDGRVVSLDRAAASISGNRTSRAKPAVGAVQACFRRSAYRRGGQPSAQAGAGCPDEAEGETDKTGEPAGDDIEAQKTVDGNAVDTEPAEEAAGDGTSQSQSAGDESVAQTI